MEKNLYTVVLKKIRNRRNYVNHWDLNINTLNKTSENGIIWSILPDTFQKRRYKNESRNRKSISSILDLQKKLYPFLHQ